MVKRILRRKVYKINRKKRAFFWILKSLGLFVMACFVAGLFVFIYYAKDLPRPEQFTERTIAQTTKIYDRTGEILLYEFYGDEKRELVPFDRISDYIKEAAIAAEDANFYEHHGIDIEGIFRAVKINLQLGRPLYGGSTISQQLIRSTFLGREKTIKRKVREVILTLELERRHNKEEILEWYLNQIPFGPNTYGVEAASQNYFGKPAKEVSLEEAATLAALIRAPSYLSPYGHHIPELLERKDYALDRMAEENFITEKEAEIAKEKEIKFEEPNISIKAPHFVFYVKDYLLKKYGQAFLEREGLKVYTSLDWDLQKKAQETVKKGVEVNYSFNAHNASLVAMSPKNGEILAMAGSADWFADPYPEGCKSGVNCKFDPKVNIATYGSGRQPGSSFKPFVYATAFEKGFDDKTIIMDEETNFGIYGGKPYIPQNYDGFFRGEVTLRQALAQSLNVPSVKVLAYLAGQEDSIKTAKEIGITTLNKDPSFYGLSIVLGGGEVRLLDMVASYSVFAAKGKKHDPVSVLKIENNEGRVIERTSRGSRKVLSEDVCELITDILSDNRARAPMFGSNSLMHFENYQVAAKTGTTNDYKDAWIIGYTPSLSVGVWAGNNDNTSMAKQPGLVIAGPIWRQFLNYSLPLIE